MNHDDDDGDDNKNNNYNPENDQLMLWYHRGSKQMSSAPQRRVWIGTPMKKYI